MIGRCQRARVTSEDARAAATMCGGMFWMWRFPQVKGEGHGVRSYVFQQTEGEDNLLHTGGEDVFRTDVRVDREYSTDV